VRDTPGALFRQYFDYGLWRVAVLRKHGRVASLRQLVPAGLVVACALSLGAPLVVPAPWSLLLLAVPAAYATGLLAGGIAAGRKHGRRLGARFLLVAVPGAAEFAGHEEISKWFPAYMPSEYDLGAPRERLRRLAEEARMEYISLYEVFAEDLRSRRGTLTDLFWWCDGHLSPHGHEVVARSLAQHVGRPRGAATAR